MFYTLYYNLYWNCKMWLSKTFKYHFSLCTSWCKHYLVYQLQIQYFTQKNPLNHQVHTGGRRFSVWQALWTLAFYTELQTPRKRRAREKPACHHVAVVHSYIYVQILHTLCLLYVLTLILSKKHHNMVTENTLLQNSVPQLDYFSKSCNPSSPGCCIEVKHSR